MTTKKASCKEVGNWDVDTTIDVDDSGGKTCPTDRISMAVLCVIRDELKAIRGVLQCPKFLGIPAQLRQIMRNTEKPQKAKPRPKKAKK